MRLSNANKQRPSSAAFPGTNKHLQISLTKLLDDGSRSRAIKSKNDDILHLQEALQHAQQLAYNKDLMIKDLKLTISNYNKERKSEFKMNLNQISRFSKGQFSVISREENNTNMLQVKIQQLQQVISVQQQSFDDRLSQQITQLEATYVGQLDNLKQDITSYIQESAIMVAKIERLEQDLENEKKLTASLGFSEERGETGTQTMKIFKFNVDTQTDIVVIRANVTIQEQERRDDQEEFDDSVSPQPEVINNKSDEIITHPLGTPTYRRPQSAIDRLVDQPLSQDLPQQSTLPDAAINNLFKQDSMPEYEQGPGNASTESASSVKSQQQVSLFARLATPKYQAPVPQMQPNARLPKKHRGKAKKSAKRGRLSSSYSGCNDSLDDNGSASIIGQLSQSHYDVQEPENDELKVTARITQETVDEISESGDVLDDVSQDEASDEASLQPIPGKQVSFAILQDAQLTANKESILQMHFPNASEEPVIVGGGIPDEDPSPRLESHEHLDELSTVSEDFDE